MTNAQFRIQTMHDRRNTVNTFSISHFASN